MDAAGPSRVIPEIKTEAPDTHLELADTNDYTFVRWSTRKRMPVPFYADLLQQEIAFSQSKPKKRKIQTSGEQKASGHGGQSSKHPVKKPVIDPDYQMDSDISEDDSSCDEVETNITEAIKTEAIKTEAIKTEAIKTEAIKTEAIKTEAIKTEAIKTEAIKTEAIKTEAFESEAEAPRRRKRPRKIDRCKLTILRDQRFDTQALPTIEGIFQKAGSKNVSDLIAPRLMGGGPHRKDARDQAIQQYLQVMLERRHPPSNERDKLLNIRVMAEAARTLGCVRCDGWCYNWLAEWSQAEGCQQIRMVELTSKVKEYEHNHYFLLVPCKPEHKFDSGWNDVGDKKLYVHGKLDSDKFSRLAGSGFWLIDPALNQVIPFSDEYFSDYIERYCRVYERDTPTQVSIKTVYDLDKEGSQSSPQDIAQIKQRALYLLPFAIVVQREYDFKKSLHQYPQLFNDLGFTPHDACPELFREGVKWTIGALFCLFSQDGEFKDILPEGRPCNLDILKCYRTESKEYFSALQKEMIKMLECGFSPEDCLGFLGPKRETAHFCNIPCQAPIPEEIYQAEKVEYQLSGPLDWQGLGRMAFEFMGIDHNTIKPDFADLVLRETEIHDDYTPDRLNDAFISFFSYGMGSEKNQYQYREDMIFNRPELKDSVCARPRKISTHLMKHCIHQARNHMAESLKSVVDLCEPIHTLHVCKADSTPYNEAMVNFLQNCIHDFMSPEEIVIALNQVIPGTRRTQRLAIELPKALYDKSFDCWSVESVNVLMALYKTNKWVKETSIEHQKNFLKSKIKHLESMSNNRQAQRDMTEYLLRQTHFVEKVAYCYPQFSAGKIRQRIASCMRFLMSEFDSPIARIQTGRNHLFCLQEYDEPALLKESAPELPGTLRCNVEEFLSEGHNLCFVARRRFCQGRTKERCMAVTNPYRAEQTCDWSFTDMLELMRNPDETNMDCMKRLVERYGDENESLKMEYGVFLAKEDVSAYDGLLMDYIHGPGKSTKFLSRLRSFNLYAKRNLPQTDKNWKGSYRELKDLAEMAINPEPCQVSPSYCPT